MKRDARRGQHRIFCGHEASFLHVSTLGADDLHVWVGPLGLHLFWPDLWKSRLDWHWGWR